MRQSKEMRLSLFWFAAAILWATSSFGQMPPSRTVRQFAVGQEWSLKSTAGAPARIVIGKIVISRGRVILHVSITDIPTHSGKVRFSTIADVPFDEAALAASVERVVATHVPPCEGFWTGYKEWKEHNGGAYGVSVGTVLRLAQRRVR